MQRDSFRLYAMSAVLRNANMPTTTLLAEFFYAFLKLKLGYSGVYGTARYKRRILGLRLLNVSLSCQYRNCVTVYHIHQLNEAADTDYG